MSADLHKTMLYFKGKTLIAKHDGVGIELGALPAFDELPKNTTEIYFYPDLCEYRLRENAKPSREMHPPEIEAVIKFLSSIAELGRRLLTGNRT